MRSRGVVATSVLAFLAAAMLAAGLAVAIAAREALQRLAGAGMPEDAIIVSGGGVGIGPLRFGDAGVPAELADEIRRHPGATGVAAEEALAAPASVTGSIMGSAYGTDVVVLGVDSGQLGWIAPGLDPSGFVDGAVIPVIAPRVVLDAYNGAFGPAHGLPGLTENAFLGRTFALEAGASSLRRSPGAFATPARLVAFSPQADLFGVIVPADFVRRANRALGADGTVRRLFVFARSPADAAAIINLCRSRGLAVSAPEDRLAALAKIDAVAAATAGGFGFIVVAMTAIAAFFASLARVLEKKDEAALLHQLAFSRAAIVARFLLPPAIPVAAASLAGSFVGITAALYSAPVHGGLLQPAFTLSPILIGTLLPIAGILTGALLGALRVVPTWRNRCLTHTLPLSSKG